MVIRIGGRLDYQYLAEDFERPDPGLDAVADDNGRLRGSRRSTSRTA